MKTIAQQIQAMRRLWPDFEVSEMAGQAVWFGSLAGIERSYRVMVEYCLPHELNDHGRDGSFPLVRVLSPRLSPRFNAKEEAPLPHVYFDEHDITLSPLCLFDPDKTEWSRNDLIAITTIPWTADWLACYEGWLATGQWHGGGRHAIQSKENHA